MSKVTKVAILGMGNMGRAHAGNLRKIPNVEITALCSQPIKDAENYAKDNKLAVKVYDDFYEMLKEGDFAVLYVCIPPFAQQGQVEAAASKGIHIFIEKPIALSVERGKSMLSAVQQNNIKTQVGYHMRFGTAVRRLKELMDSGVSGKPLLYTANYECNSLHAPWWIDVEKCGGQVFEQIIHLYDMAIYLLGQPLQANGYIANLNHKEVEGYTVEDTSISAIQFVGGALAGISGSNCAIPNEWNGIFKVVFQNMVAECKDHNHARFIFTKENNRIEEICEDCNAGYLEDQYFMEVVNGREEEFASIKEGYLGLKLVKGVVESSKNSGKTIVIGKE